MCIFFYVLLMRNVCVYLDIFLLVFYVYNNKKVHIYIYIYICLCVTHLNKMSHMSQFEHIDISIISAFT